MAKEFVKTVAVTLAIVFTILILPGIAGMDGSKIHHDIASTSNGGTYGIRAGIGNGGLPDSSHTSMHTGVSGLNRERLQ